MSAFQHFAAGRLPELVRERAESARRTGALQTVSTDYCFHEQAGIPFVIRTVANLERKEIARRLQRHEEGRTGQPVNPFLPPDERLIVTDLSPTHRCILNKFNVVQHHLLLVTREFRDQREPLAIEDFEALWLTLREIDGLGFYNAGRRAGASQRHKHLQLVTLPLAPDGPAIPLEPKLKAYRSEGPHTVDGLPFQHRALWTGLGLDLPPDAAAHVLSVCYERLAASLKVDVSSTPYNLMVTRSWMLMVPRSHERYQGVAVNTLGFAGSLLVRSSEELELVKRVGPLSVLAHVGVAPGQ